MSCAVPAAVPDDGVDDRAAIQAALNSGCATLGPGVYDIVTPPSPVGGRRTYQMLAVNTHLGGAGSSTVLRFSGDAGGVDWWGVLLGTQGVLENISLDTSALTGTSEQTHAVRINGPAMSPVVSQVSFVHPQRGLPGGDCIQVVGYPGAEVVGARILDSMFTKCDRSAIAVHSGAHDLQITGSAFPDTGDVHINFEGTGDIDSVLIANDTFGLSPTAQSDFAIELDLATHVRITDCISVGSGILVYDSSSVEIDLNDVMRTLPGSSSAVVEVSKGSSGINIHDDVFERAAGVIAGPVIRAIPHGTGTPSNLTIAGSRLIQHTNASVIASVGVVGLTVWNDTLSYAGMANSAFGLDAVGSTTVRTDRIRVETCSFSGPLIAEIRVSGSYAGTGSVALAGNTGASSSQGLRCENVFSGSQVLGPVTFLGASPWPLNVCGPPGFVSPG